MLRTSILLCWPKIDWNGFLSIFELGDVKSLNHHCYYAAINHTGKGGIFRVEDIMTWMLLVAYLANTKSL